MSDKKEVLAKLEEFTNSIPSSYAWVCQALKDVIESDFATKEWHEFEGIKPQEIRPEEQENTLPIFFDSGIQQIYDLSFGLGVKMGWNHKKHPKSAEIISAIHLINRLSVTIHDNLKKEK